MDSGLAEKQQSVFIRESTVHKRDFTRLGVNVPNETDATGNPLVDDLMGPNNLQKAYDDLWFYSNPIFIDVQ